MEKEHVENNDVLRKTRWAKETHARMFRGENGPIAPLSEICESRIFGKIPVLTGKVRSMVGRFSKSLA
jgi:hypothetical protein